MEVQTRGSHQADRLINFAMPRNAERVGNGCRVESAGGPYINTETTIQTTKKTMSISKNYSGERPDGGAAATATVTDKLTGAAPVTTAFTPGLNYSGFNRGLAQVLHIDHPQIMKEIKEALGITARSGVHAYRDGKVRIRADQAARLQQVFNKRGIYEIWDS